MPLSQEENCNRGDMLVDIGIFSWMGYRFLIPLVRQMSRKGRVVVIYFGEIAQKRQSFMYVSWSAHFASECGLESQVLFLIKKACVWLVVTKLV